MSNSLAVATVTKSLQHLLMASLNNFAVTGDVTTRPPDKARATLTGNQLNVFLYHTTIDGAWRNQDMPSVRPGETSFPPLPLVLHYVLTAYGANDDDIAAHTVLGRAMSVLHDHPILGPDEFKDVVAGTDLDQQIERVRITPQPLSVDEMYRLWTAFQTQYRISAAYEVSVVLIESTQPKRTPLPVLTRGEGDSGAVTQTGTVAPFPTLEAAVPPHDQPSALSGDELTLTGHHLAGASAVGFLHPLVEVPPALPASVSGAEIKVAVPGELPAGVCAVAALFGQPDQPDHTSNGFPFAVAPQITSGLSPPSLARDTAPKTKDNVTVVLGCSPQVLPGQRAFLLLGERQIPLESVLASPTGTLRFLVTKAEPGDYLVRLRVDGVDSLLVDRSVTPPIFDTTQTVTIT
ncbi:MAG: DUF4255 domain-containing protein [Egibacteraceae bacterium]